MSLSPISRSFLFLLLTLLTAACGSATPTAAPQASTSPTIASMLTPSATGTPFLPTGTPTPLVFVGEITIQVNVRSGPGSGYESLGLLDAGVAVQVTLQSDDRAWYRILYPQAVDGFGWVAAQYVAFAGGTPFFFTPTGQVSQDASTGVVLQRLNVRSGPGTTFETLGMLDPQAVVVLTARNATTSWFQIVYPAGTDTRGWVTAQYVQTDNASALPVVDEYGQPMITGTPGSTPIPMTPTPTLGPAFADGDSSAHPAVSVIFSSVGTRQFTYSSQVSSPDGDAEDWLEFTPFSSLPGAQAHLLVSLSCQGNGTLLVELWQAGAALAGWGTLACGDSDRALSLAAGAVYQFRLEAVPGDGLQLTHYSLTMQNQP